ncbi:serine hydrolase domain-containing protein [Altererythrobacter sp. H2]|uniref:serine hydrolase domain-containing protein n=1 Tax=Altererythrobacter sp. H2 TaxID=3108391 RepID=UPI002B4BB0FB|nr:serine hydrolase domain-containing protein [Altererythrobacter sp. H2]WRK95701.1 serine hydrolase domain-containing protein [Altererythrobacter sp. H2]
MLRRLLAAFALSVPLTPATAGSPPPASVVVAFDRESVRPLIVEGQANRETGRAVEANDPVRIASISKLIMALTALRLMDEGKVDLSRDVSDYLGWSLRSPHHPQAPVSIAHLLSHRAGLSDKAGYVIPLGESLGARLADPAAWRDTGPPGEAAFEYANLGSPLVATALEAASGERYDRLVERLVFAPLGVKACLNWLGCDAGMQDRAVTLYRHTGEIARDDPADLPPNCTIPVADGVACNLDTYVPGTNASVFSPQGGVRIGMMDLAKIGQALLWMEHNEFLSDNAMRLWLGALIEAANRQAPADAAPTFCAYGLGAYTLTGEGPCSDDLFMDGRERIGHGGEAYGLRSGLWFTLEAEQGFAYFITEIAPPPGGEDTGGSDPREVELLARALKLASDQ